jgi:putative aldouronate transport system substrate-binding protein
MKRVWPLIVLTAVLASACSNTATGPATADSGNPNSAGKPIDITFAVEGAGLPELDKDVIVQELNTRLNINLKVTGISSDFTNQLNVKIAANDMPDIVGAGLININEYAKQGLLLELTPYLNKELKPTRDFMVSLSNETILKKGTIDGKNYAILKNPDVPFSSYWIRNDWLKKLNLQTPKTLDELVAVAKAFTEKDPDGNGAKDTYGFTGNGLSTFTPILGAFSVGSLDSFYEKNGKYVSAYYDPDIVEALGYINKIISDNLIMPQLMTNKGLAWRDQAFQGKAGIVFAGWPDMGKDQFIQEYKAINPNADWVQISAPKGPKGAFNGSFDYEKPSRYYVFPKKLESNPEKLKKVFELLNYVSGKEGNDLVMFGVEGKHYNVKDGQVVPTDLLTTDGNYFHYYQFTGRNTPVYDKVKFPNQQVMKKFAIDEPRLKSYDSSVDIPKNYNSADAKRYAEEEIVKFVSDKRPLSEYPEFLKTLETTYKYNLLNDEAQKTIKQLGLIK